MQRRTIRLERRTPARIASELMAEAGQEGCDGGLYDLMQEGGEALSKLNQDHQRLVAACTALVDKLPKGTQHLHVYHAREELLAVREALGQKEGGQ